MIDPYMMYMAEQEGLLNTKESKIRKIIKIIRNYPRREISNSLFHAICKECGINSDDLTKSEMEYINRAIQC